MRDANGNIGIRNRGNNNTNDDDDDDDEKGYGDTRGPLNNNHLRIGFQNIGGLSSNNTEQDKLLQQFIQSNSFDFFGSVKSTSSGQHYGKNCSLKKG
jgi:hypothetical protein